MNYIDYDSYFDQDVADNFCILKYNIEIQIENIKSVITFEGINKTQIKDLRHLLEKYRSLSKKTNKTIIKYKHIFRLIDEFDDLTRRLEDKLSRMDNSLPVITCTEQFVDMYGGEYYQHLLRVSLN